MRVAVRNFLPATMSRAALVTNTLIEWAIRDLSDSFCKIGVFLVVFVSEQDQIVEGVACQYIADAIGGREFCDFDERTSTPVQFIKFGVINGSIAHAAKSLSPDLGSEYENRGLNLEWHDSFAGRGNRGLAPARMNTRLAEAHSFRLETLSASFR